MCDESKRLRILVIDVMPKIKNLQTSSFPFVVG